MGTGPIDVATEAAFVGDNEATWPAEIDIHVPATAITGVYTGTVTHSVS